jgi:hypothetical protein
MPKPEFAVAAECGVCLVCVACVVQLDWGSRDDPCHSLTTEGDLPDLVVEEWFHVGFTLSGGVESEGSAIIYINGRATIPLLRSEADAGRCPTVIL